MTHRMEPGAPGSESGLWRMERICEGLDQTSAWRARLLGVMKKRQSSPGCRTRGDFPAVKAYPLRRSKTSHISGGVGGYVCFLAMSSDRAREE